MCFTITTAILWCTLLGFHHFTRFSDTKSEQQSISSESSPAGNTLSGSEEEGGQRRWMWHEKGRQRGADEQEVLMTRSLKTGRRRRWWWSARVIMNEMKMAASRVEENVWSEERWRECNLASGGSGATHGRVLMRWWNLKWTPQKLKCIVLVSARCVGQQPGVVAMNPKLLL